MDDIASALYNRNLKTTKFVLQVTRGVYALPDRDLEDIHGIIPMTWKNPSHYVIIKKTNEQNFICSCGENPYGNCIHIVAGQEFISRNDIVDDTLLDTDIIYPIVALQEQSTLEPGRLWGYTPSLMQVLELLEKLLKQLSACVAPIITPVVTKKLIQF